MNQLAKNFNFQKLLRFATPTIVMTIFSAIYTMADGMFVSAFVSTNALAAVNIIFPFLSMVMGIAFMLATGGGAILAKQMGEGKDREVNENFTSIFILAIILGASFMILGMVFPKEISLLLGADSDTIGYAEPYMFYLSAFAPLAILQMMFGYLFVTAGKPITGMIVSSLGGLANIILDYLFIGVFGFGVVGAAVATGLGVTIPAVYGLVYFAFNKKGTLKLVKPRYHKGLFSKTCINGASEMVTNLAGAIMTLLFNINMGRLLGSDGIAAITIVQYSQFLLLSLFFGYSNGVAPVVSYKLGNNDTEQTKTIFKISMIFISVGCLVACAVSYIIAKPIVILFAGSNPNVIEIAVKGFYIFAISYLFQGINVFASAYFTALNNGKISGILSFIRTLVLIVICLVILPKIMGVLGVWLAVPIAEILSIFLSAFCFIKYRKEYKYY